MHCILLLILGKILFICQGENYLVFFLSRKLSRMYLVGAISNLVFYLTFLLSPVYKEVKASFLLDYVISKIAVLSKFVKSTVANKNIYSIQRTYQSNRNNNILHHRIIYFIFKYYTIFQK